MTEAREPLLETVTHGLRRRVEMRLTHQISNDEIP